MENTLIQLSLLNEVASTLAREMHDKLLNARHQLDSLELTLLELLACHQQKYDHLIQLNKQLNNHDTKLATLDQHQLVLCLDNILTQWQEQREINKLEIALARIEHELIRDQACLTD